MRVKIKHQLDPNDNRRNFPRYNLQQLPRIEASLDYIDKREKLTDLSYGGCRFEYVEEAHKGFFQSPLSRIVFVVIDWPDQLLESIFLRGRVVYEIEELDSIMSFKQVGIKFIEHDRDELFPLVCWLEKIAS